MHNEVNNNVHPRPATVATGFLETELVTVLRTVTSSVAVRGGILLCMKVKLFYITVFHNYGF